MQYKLQPEGQQEQTNFLLDYCAQIISKIVLVIVAPHYGIAFLVRQRAQSLSNRSSAQSAKLFKAQHSRKEGF